MSEEERQAAPQTPLATLSGRLPALVQQADHSEMWGVELSADAVAAPVQVVLQKFLRANAGDAAAAERQLVEALRWRRAVKPRELVHDAFDRRKFGDLGYVTTHRDAAGRETVITWNIYGAVKDNKATFGDVKEFIRWRAALMELGIEKLRLNEIKERVADGAEDEHMMIQVHDYMSVSFFRMDPAVRAASKETIQTFSMAYPELLAHKYFVNVPPIMGWMYAAMKLFLAPTTLRKFHPMASGATLATELQGIGPQLPKEYGGDGPSVTEGETVRLEDKGAGDDTKGPAIAASSPDAAATDEPRAAPGDKSPAAGSDTAEGILKEGGVRDEEEAGDGTGVEAAATAVEETGADEKETS